MRTNVFGVLIFLLAFLMGTAVALWSSMPEIPTLSNGFPVGETVSCKFKVEPDVDESQTIQTPSTPLTISVRRHNPDFEIEEFTIEPVARGPLVTNVDLDLGESIEEQLIVLTTSKDWQYKVEQQFETSMAIGDEGPHYDMLDWKHYTSPWKEIEQLSKNRFRTTRISEADITRFPKVTRKEIVEAFKKDGANKRWIEHARTCDGPNSGPCYVSVSRISFRISVSEKRGWKVLHTLNFSIPMGC